MNRRAAQRAAIQRTYDIVHGEDFQDLGLPLIRERIHVLGTAYERFNNEHMAVVENLVMPNDLEVHHEFAEEVEHLYITSMYKLRERLAELEPALVPQVQERNEPLEPQQENQIPRPAMGNDIRLEPITLDSFGGEYNKWSEWRAMYDSLVHNNEKLSKTQKFHYLKKSLGDVAERVLSGWQVTGENYEQAYNTLVNVFENKYRIILSHLDELMKLEPSKLETIESVRKLIDTTNKVLRQLRVIGCPVEHWDDMIVYVLIVRMAPRTLQAWETSQDLREMPTLVEILNFLERRSRGIINLQQNQPSTSGENNSVKNKNNGAIQKDTRLKQPKQPMANRNESWNDVGCYHCNLPHPLHRCIQFRNMSVNQRRDRTREMKLCFNCFKPTHNSNSKSCPFGECKHCPGKRHNTLLCPKVSQNSASVNTVRKNDESVSNQLALPSQQGLSVAAPMFVPPGQNFQ